MARFKFQCPHCGAKMLIIETDDRWAGCKEKEEVYCYRCHEVAYSRMTSGLISATPLTDDEYNTAEDL